MTAVNGIRVLSMRQPWAWLVATGYKIIETRTWRTNYRGLFLIHASGKWDKRAQTDYDAILDAAYKDIELPILSIHNVDNLKYTGGIIGSVDLIAITPFSKFKWNHTAKKHLVPLERGYEGRWAWYLHDAMKYPEPIPCKGMLKLWTPTESVMEKAMKQMRQMIHESG